MTSDSEKLELYNAAWFRRHVTQRLPRMYSGISVIGVVVVSIYGLGRRYFLRCEIKLPWKYTKYDNIF